MSYNVEYNPELRSRYPEIKKKHKHFSIPTVLVIAFSLMAGIIVAKNNLFRFLIPGDPDVTVEAFHSMVEKIESGVSVGEGVLEFCEEIIINAQ